MPRGSSGKRSKNAFAAPMGADAASAHPKTDKKGHKKSAKGRSSPLARSRKFQEDPIRRYASPCVPFYSF